MNIYTIFEENLHKEFPYTHKLEMLKSIVLYLQEIKA